jgi:hypothetical protein
MMNTNFAMMQHHNYSLADLENLIPWERTVYVNLLLRHIAEEKARQEKEKHKK